MVANGKVRRKSGGDSPKSAGRKRAASAGTPRGKSFLFFRSRNVAADGPSGGETRTEKRPGKVGGRNANSKESSGSDKGAPLGGFKEPNSKKASRRRLKWPVIEVVLFLLLVKIGAGAWVLLSGPEVAREMTSVGGSDFQTAQISSQPAKTVSLDSYLTAAVEAVASPSLAQASSTAIVASSSASAAPLASGAMMAVFGQSAAPPMAQGGSAESIPLPPGADLLTPAAELPPPSLPQVGSGVVGNSRPSNRGSAPLPPNAAPVASGEIRQREQTLALKEAELASREEALKALDADLRRRQSAIDNFRNEQESMISRNEALLAELRALREQQQKEEEIGREASIQQLVAAYGAMKPEQAGALVNSLDDEVAVAILSVMSGRKAGLILANVVPEKAARLTKAISERRIDPNRILADNPAVAGFPEAP